MCMRVFVSVYWCSLTTGSSKTTVYSKSMELSESRTCAVKPHSHDNITTHSLLSFEYFTHTVCDSGTNNSTFLFGLFVKAFVV